MSDFKQRAFLALAAAVSFLPSCGRQANQLPTATEIFHLRSECAALGEKIQNRDGALTMRSRYDPGKNRCYVELKGAAEGGYYFHQVCDGQTGELLASTITGPGDNPYVSGVAKNLPPGMKPRERYVAVEDLITAMMTDDRKP